MAMELGIVEKGYIENQAFRLKTAIPTLINDDLAMMMMIQLILEDVCKYGAKQASSSLGVGE
ncbi:hypothetical protein ACFQZE_23865 [Paenibacillus sp. GCM10027627]|uniref:hypothetical protein n=1 Tax=unclassified Paenibacillus TaxID=185978 RepID=UPI0036412C3C